jgi:hypothetical protein
LSKNNLGGGFSPVARLATGWGGYPFAGRDSHPLDDIPNFMNSSHDSLPSDQPFLVALKTLPTKNLHSIYPNALLPSRKMLQLSEHALVNRYWASSVSLPNIGTIPQLPMSLDGK